MIVLLTEGYLPIGNKNICLNYIFQSLWKAYQKHSSCLLESESCLGEWVENLSCVWMENILHCLYRTVFCWGSSLKLKENTLIEPLLFLIFKKETLTSKLFNKCFSNIVSRFLYTGMSAITGLLNVRRNTLCPTVRVGKAFFEGKIGSWPNWTGAFFFFVRERGSLWLSYFHHVHMPSIFLPRTRSGAAAKCFQVPLPSEYG